MLRGLRFQLRVWWSRKLSYQAAWLLALCLLSLITLWLGRTLSQRSAALTPRLFEAGRHEVWLELNALPPAELHQLQGRLSTARYGVPVMVVRPELKLIGTLEELNSELLKLREEQFKLRMAKSTGQLGQTHLLKQTKRDIARVKTALNEKVEG